jgi:La-related protein 7
MAQESRDSSGPSSSTSGPCTSECSTPFKFNVHAPEFVPMSSPLTAAGYFSPFV